MTETGVRRPNQTTLQHFQNDDGLNESLACTCLCSLIFLAVLSLLHSSHTGLLSVSNRVLVFYHWAFLHVTFPVMLLLPFTQLAPIHPLDLGLSIRKIATHNSGKKYVLFKYFLTFKHCIPSLVYH